MCYYKRYYFTCGHALWAHRVKLCIHGQRYKDGDRPEDCKVQKPHGIKTQRLDGKCSKCNDLDQNLVKIRSLLKNCRELVENMNKREEQQRKEARAKIEEKEANEEKEAKKSEDVHLAEETLVENRELSTIGEESYDGDEESETEETEEEGPICFDDDDLSDTF